jgi:ABC-type nitrate/sulfonate/bicarbonate transport system ATPase subunit
MSRRPGKILEIIPIELPRPRDENLVSDKRYLEYVDLIWNHVKDQAKEALEEKA